MSAYLEENFEDFRACKREFEESIRILRMRLGNEPVDRLVENISKLCEADLLFCGSLGYQANLNNFRDPIARTFLDADFEDYLRMNVMARMPRHSRAENEINAFYHSLSEELRGAYEGVSSYLVYMVSNLTKLAHYRGFMLANEMLCYTEPGYSPNFVLSLRYHGFMEKWFGVSFALKDMGMPLL